jgi:mono/diheme cytochrome c family protein
MLANRMLVTTKSIAVAAGAYLAATVVSAAGAGAADGAAIFQDVCKACHADGGVGTPGLAPPLVSPVVASSAAKKPDYALLVVLHGLSGPLPLSGGDSISGIMPPIGLRLSDDEIAAVVGYVFGTLNTSPVKIDPKMVAELRVKSPTAKELRAMREELQK